MKIVSFSNVHHLSLFFPRNFGDESSRVYYIGLKGDFTPVSLEQPLASLTRLSRRRSLRETHS